MDPAVIQALTEAVAAAPDNQALRLHLADVLLSAGQTDKALGEVHHVLSSSPDSVTALQLAVKGHQQAGEPARAERYQHVLGALGGGHAGTDAHQHPAPPHQSPPAAPPASPAPGHMPPPAPDHKPPSAADQHPSRYGAEPTEPLSANPTPSDDLDSFLEEVLAEASADRVTLDDVAGLEDVKRRLRLSFLEPIRNPSLRRHFRKNLTGGLLLYGPPGCGKTYLARAIAGELGVRFLSMGLAEILEHWFGASERNLHEVFESARRLSPCVLFLDEVDALGMKRSNLSHSAGRNVVVQLLTELDSGQSENDGLFVLGATNAPWDIDSALRRPGRFDRTVLVLPPDAPAREAMVRANLKDRPSHDVDVARVAQNTEGFSGADIRLLIDEATELAMEDSVKAGDVKPITNAHLDRARHGMRPSTSAWFEQAKTVATFANSDGAYDELLDFMRGRRRKR